MRSRRCGDLRLSAAASGRSTACAATSRTTWSSRRISSIRCTASRCSASTARCAGRRAAMLDCFDVLLVDLQDLGCRIYTFITTLRYVLEEAARTGKSVWVLDRPNPVGRPVEGLTLRAGWESFVGAGPLPMRHGLTHGRAGALVRRDAAARRRLPGGRDARAGSRDAAPGYGWPLGERTWVNPSPNAPNLWMARCYAGSVMLEGTDALGGPRHDAAAGAARRAGPRRAGAACRRCTRSRPQWLDGLPPAPLLVRADLPQARGPAVRRLPGARGGSARSTTTRRSSPGGCSRSRSRRCAGCARLRAVARLPLRVRGHGRLPIDVINGSDLLRDGWTIRRDPGGSRRPGARRRDRVGGGAPRGAALLN